MSPLKAQAVRIRVQHSFDMKDDCVLGRADGLLVFISNIQDLLQPTDLRPFLACYTATSWPKMQIFITKTVRTVMTSHHAQYVAAQECSKPRADWTEDSPICASPSCTARTGLWLPSKEEITTLTERGQYAPFEFMCENYNWGSITLRSVIENMEDGVECVWDKHGPVRTGGRALVACSLNCAKVLREIARIQRKHDYVLLASHVREPPEVNLLLPFIRYPVSEPPDVCRWIAARSHAIPSGFLLLSEIDRRDAYNAIDPLDARSPAR